MIAVEKADAEASLAEALPALEEARIALSDLDKSDVTEIRYIQFFILEFIMYLLLVTQFVVL